MKKHTIIVGILFFVLAFVIACTNDKNDNTKQNVSLRFDWFTSMTFAGEVWAYDEFASKQGINLKLDPGSESTDPVKLVLGGTDDFGCISVDKFLAANEKGADLVAIGVINQLSPTVFIS